MKKREKIVREKRERKKEKELGWLQVKIGSQQPRKIKMFYIILFPERD
jgi:hypothetical protein